MLFSEQLLNPLVAVLKSDRLAYTDMGEDGGVLLDIAGHQVFTLNEVGMYLVNLSGEGGAERVVASPGGTNAPPARGEPDSERRGLGAGLSPGVRHCPPDRTLLPRVREVIQADLAG